MEATIFTYTDSKNNSYDFSGFIDRYYNDLTNGKGMDASSIVEKLKSEFGYEKINATLIGRGFTEFCDKKKDESDRKTYYRLKQEYQRPEPEEEDQETDTSADETSDVEILKKHLRIIPRLNNKSENIDICAMLFIAFMKSEMWEVMDTIPYPNWASRSFDIMSTNKESAGKLCQSFIEKFLKRHNFSKKISGTFMISSFSIIIELLDNKYKWSEKYAEKKRLAAEARAKQALITPKKKDDKEDEDYQKMREESLEKQSELLTAQAEYPRREEAKVLNVPFDEYIAWYNKYFHRLNSFNKDILSRAQERDSPIDYYKFLHRYVGKDISKADSGDLSSIKCELARVEPDHPEIKRYEEELDRRYNEEIARCKEEHERMIERQRERKEKKAKKEQEYLEFGRNKHLCYVQWNHKGKFRKVHWDESRQQLWRSGTDDEDSFEKPIWLPKSEIQSRLHVWLKKEEPKAEETREETPEPAKTKKQTEAEMFMNGFMNMMESMMEKKMKKIAKHQAKKQTKGIKKNIKKRMSDIEDQQEELENAQISNRNMLNSMRRDMEGSDSEIDVESDPEVSDEYTSESDD